MLKMSIPKGTWMFYYFRWKFKVQICAHSVKGSTEGKLKNPSTIYTTQVEVQFQTPKHDNDMKHDQDKTKS